VDTGSREENASKQEIQSPVPISIGTETALMLMMNGESVVAAASAAMTSAANQLELVSSGSQWPGLVAGKLAHICERLASRRVTSSSSASRDVRPHVAIMAIGLPADGCSAPLFLPNPS
jgi:hypothetical protein